MSEAQHTPRPWRTKTPDGEREVFSVKDIHGHVVARVSGYSISAIPPRQRRANARLIAEAPEMRAVLVDLTNDEHTELSWAIMDRVNALIAKVDGATP